MKLKTFLWVRKPASHDGFHFVRVPKRILETRCSLELEPESCTLTVTDIGPQSTRSSTDALLLITCTVCSRAEGNTYRDLLFFDSDLQPINQTTLEEQFGMCELMPFVWMFFANNRPTCPPVLSAGSEDFNIALPVDDWAELQMRY